MLLAASLNLTLEPSPISPTEKIPMPFRALTIQLASDIKPLHIDLDDLVTEGAGNLSRNARRGIISLLRNECSIESEKTPCMIAVDEIASAFNRRRSGVMRPGPSFPIPCPSSRFDIRNRCKLIIFAGMSAGTRHERKAMREFAELMLSHGYPALQEGVCTCRER